MMDQSPDHNSSRERVVAFERMERIHRFFDARFDGWSPWRVMRNTLHRQNLTLPIAPMNRSQLHRSLKAMLESFRFAWLLLTLRQRRIVVKTSRSGLRMQVGERYRDVYFDGLLQREVSYIKIEENNSPDFAHQARNALYPSNLDPVFFTFWGTVLGKFRPVDSMPFCQRISQILQQECGLTVAPEWLLLRISTVYWQAKLYGLLLDRIRPKVVMVSDTGEYGLRLASLKRRIKFIELQHGIFDACHPDAIPDWVEGKAGELLLPDVLACRGTYWIDQLKHTRQGRDSAKAVGNELIDLARANRRRSSSPAALQIVVSSQGLDSARLAEWLNAMIAAAPKDLAWSLSIKLHPVYDANTMEFDSLSRNPNVQIIGGSEAPNVFDLLSVADLHLSIASACHFDAAALGVPSAIIPLSGHEAMLPAAREQILILAATPQSIWEIVNSPHVRKADPEHFSTPGFVENIARLLADEDPFGSEATLRSPIA